LPLEVEMHLNARDNGPKLHAEIVFLQVSKRELAQKTPV